MQMTKGLWFAICAQFLLFAGVHSVPLGTSDDNQAISEGANHLEGVTTEDQNSQNFDDGEEPTPTAAYLEEIQEQVEAPRTDGEEEPLMRDTRSTCSHSGTKSTKNVINCMLEIAFHEYILVLKYMCSTKFLFVILFHDDNLYVESMCMTRHSTCCDWVCDTK